MSTRKTNAGTFNLNTLYRSKSGFNVEMFCYIMLTCFAAVFSFAFFYYFLCMTITFDPPLMINLVDSPNYANSIKIVHLLTALVTFTAGIAAIYSLKGYYKKIVGLHLKIDTDPIRTQIYHLNDALEKQKYILYRLKNLGTSDLNQAILEHEIKEQELKKQMEELEKLRCPDISVFRVQDDSGYDDDYVIKLVSLSDQSKLELVTSEYPYLEVESLDEEDVRLYLENHKQSIKAA